MLRPANSPGKTPESDNRLSLAQINGLRHQAHGSIHAAADRINLLASAVEEVDAALLSASERNLDEQAALVNAARRLAGLLDDGSAVRE